MADDKFFGEESSGEIISDSGLGNLPPLSDFDSQSGIGASDAGLPPLGGFDEVGRGGYDDGGLPPISDIDVETPQPSGISTPPPTAASGVALETPVESRSGGFRDMGHDSDFSPETPEVGAGIPDSHLDTPMFDSAFGGGAVFEQNAPAAPPQPTQAMDAPAFGGGGGGFGGGAFGGAPAAPAGGGGAAGGGAFGGFTDSGFGMGAGFGGGGGQRPAGAGVATPAPDFSPDTAMKPVAVSGGGGGGGVGMLALVAAIIVCLGLGLAGGFFAQPFIKPPQDLSKEVATLKVQITQKDAKITELEDTIKQVGELDKIAELKKERDQVVAERDAAKTEIEQLGQQVTTARAESDSVKEQQAALNEKYLAALAEYEELKNETTIIQARQDGLSAEVERLTGMVGQLDEANTQRIATKESFASSVDRLTVEIKEGIPIAPAKYAYSDRLAAAETLREQLNSVNSISPAMVQAYTDLLVKESQIARSTEYFFANLPLTDEFGNTTKKWCECVMKGNWAIYYLALDGKNVGVYTNLGTMEAPQWGFKENLPARVQKEVADDVMANRVPDYAAKLQILAQKEAAEITESGFQLNYNAL